MAADLNTVTHSLKEWWIEQMRIYALLEPHQYRKAFNNEQTNMKFSEDFTDEN